MQDFVHLHVHTQVFRIDGQVLKKLRRIFSEGFPPNLGAESFLIAAPDFSTFKKRAHLHVSPFKSPCFLQESLVLLLESSYNIFYNRP